MSAVPSLNFLFNYLLCMGLPGVFLLIGIVLMVLLVVFSPLIILKRITQSDLVIVWGFISFFLGLIILVGGVINHNPCMYMFGFSTSFVAGLIVAVGAHS